MIIEYNKTLVHKEIFEKIELNYVNCTSQSASEVNLGLVGLVGFGLNLNLPPHSNYFAFCRSTVNVVSDKNRVFFYWHLSSM